jgi:hypothetical protein
MDHNQTPDARYIRELKKHLTARDAEIEGYRHELAAAKCCDSHQNVVDQLQAQIDAECEENKRLRRALDLVTHCEECCGGNLTYREMVAFCIRTARAALSEEE